MFNSLFLFILTSFLFVKGSFEHLSLQLQRKIKWTCLDMTLKTYNL